MSRDERANRSLHDPVQSSDRMRRIKEEAAAKSCLEKVRRIQEHGNCNLCGGSPDFPIVFIPTREIQRRLLVPPGSTRYVIVALCKTCFDLPDAMDRVDQIITQQANSMGNRPGLN